VGGQEACGQRADHAVSLFGQGLGGPSLPGGERGKEQNAPAGNAGRHTLGTRMR